MEEKQQWEYQKNCLLGAVGAALLIVGDLCLSMVSANKADSGLYMREAYLSGERRHIAFFIGFLKTQKLSANNRAVVLFKSFCKLLNRLISVR